MARRVASETAIHQRRVSIPSVAVADFARQIFERFDDKHTLVIGAGEMAEETLRYLRDEGRPAITVVNRSTRAGRRSWPQRWQGRARPWERAGRGAGRGRPGDQHHRGRPSRSSRWRTFARIEAGAVRAAAVHSRPGRAARFRAGHRRPAGRLSLLDRRPAGGLRAEPPRARQGTAGGRCRSSSRRRRRSWPSCATAPPAR